MKSQGKDTTEKVRRMKELKKLSLKEELDREAEMIEEKVRKRHDLDDLTVSEEAETALFNKIQDYEYDKRFKKTVHRSRKKRRILLAVAAVLILICGSVITGTGSKSYPKVLMERLVGEEKATIINVDDMDSQETEDIDELQVVKGKDYITLVTCTPYGVNTHRLLVKAEQVEYEEYVEPTQETNNTPVQEVVNAIEEKDYYYLGYIIGGSILIILFIILITRIILKKLKRKNSKHNNSRHF